MATNTNQHTSIAAVWSTMSTADRFAMLGHDRPELNPDEERTLATRVAELRKSQLTPAGTVAKGTQAGRGPRRTSRGGR